MADNAQSEIRLLVTTEADPAALKQTAAAVEQLGEAQKTAAPAAAVQQQEKMAEAIEHVEKAAPKAAEAVEKVATAEKHSTEAADKAVKTTATLTVAKEKLATATGNSSQRMLIWGQAAQDAMYGPAALANQAGQLAQSLGFGTGVAGGALMAATAITIVSNNFDIFGTKAKEAEAQSWKSAEAMREAMQDQARTSTKALEENNRNIEGLKNLEKAIEAVTKKYDEQREAVEKLTKSKREAIEFDQKKDDAQLRLDLAKLKEKYPEGGAAYEKEKTAALNAAEDRKHAREQEDLKVQREQAEKMGKAAQDESLAFRTQAEDLTDKSAGMLTKEELENAKKKQRAGFQMRENGAIEMNRAKEWGLSDDASLFMQAATITAQGDDFDTGGLTPAQYAAKQRDQEQARRQKDAYRLMQEGKRMQDEAQAAIDADKQAREATKFGDRKEAEARINDLREKQKKAEETAEAQSATKADLAKKAENSDALYGLDKEARTIESRNTIAQAQRREDEKKKQEEERARRERESNSLKDLAAQSRSKLADVDLRKSRGEIDPAEAARQKAAIRAQTEKDRAGITAADDDARAGNLAGAAEKQGQAGAAAIDRREAQRKAQQIERLLKSGSGDTKELLDKLLNVHERNGADLKSILRRINTRIDTLESQYQGISDGN
jgi:hypothetical protein